MDLACSVSPARAATRSSMKSMRCLSGTSGTRSRTGGGAGIAWPGCRPSALRTSRNICSRCMLAFSLLPKVAEAFGGGRREVALAEPAFDRGQHFEARGATYPWLARREFRRHFSGEAVQLGTRHGIGKHLEGELLQLIGGVFGPGL